MDYSFSFGTSFETLDITDWFKFMFGEVKYLNTNESTKLFIDQRSVMKLAKTDLGEAWAFPEDEFRGHVIGTWIDSNYSKSSPFGGKKYFFFDTSKVNGSGGLNFDMEALGKQRQIAVLSTSNFVWGQGPGLPSMRGNYQPWVGAYAELATPGQAFLGTLGADEVALQVPSQGQCQFLATHEGPTAWSPRNKWNGLLVAGQALDLFDPEAAMLNLHQTGHPVPHRHHVYYASKEKHGFTVSTQLHEEFSLVLDYPKYRHGFDHHTHEIVNGKMLPAGSPPHVHSWTEPGQQGKDIQTPTEFWASKGASAGAADVLDGVLAEVYEPLYLNFMWLHMNNAALAHLAGNGSLESIESDGYQSEDLHEQFVRGLESNLQTKLFKYLGEKHWGIPSFYPKNNTLINKNTLTTTTPIVFSENSFKLRSVLDGADLKMSFNDYDKCYAEALAKAPNHGILPNLYLNVLQIEDPFRFRKLFKGGGPIIQKFGPIYGDIYSMGESPYFLPAGLPSIDSGLEPYFNAWIHSMNDGHAPSDNNIDRTNQILFPSVYYLNKYTSQEHVYPWAAELRLRTTVLNGQTLVGKMHSTQKHQIPDFPGASLSEYLTQWFMRWIVDYIEDNEGNTVGPPAPEGIDWWPGHIAKSDDFYVKGENVCYESGLPTWYLGRFLMPDQQNYLEDLSSLTTEEIENLAYSLDIKKGLVIDPPPQNLDDRMEAAPGFGGAKMNLNETILAVHIAQTMANMKKNHAKSGHGPRCVADMLNGELAYAEPVFYGLEKSTVEIEDTGPHQEKVVQKFYIAAPFEDNLINFIDTQLKYDTSYTYNAYAYVLVVGNYYQYNNAKTLPLPFMLQGKTYVNQYGKKAQKIKINLGPNGEPAGLITAINRPSIKIVKVPYTSFATIHVADRAPTPPFVEMHPYKNVNNKLSFCLSETVGNFDAKPVIIMPEDKETFLKAYHSNKVNPKFSDTLPETIEFSADSKVTNYQVFRIDKHPVSYGDFARGYRQLPPGQDYVVEKFVPNKKYYYTFRSVDQNGYVSNPTDIYEVQIVDENGATYPIIKTVGLTSKFPKTKEKSGHKYVQIVPSFLQSTLRVDKNQPSAFDTKPSFGKLFGTEESPTRFKIRFTSKSSCRQFDINVNFIHKHDADPAENFKWNDENRCYEYVHGGTPQDNEEGKKSPWFRIPGLTLPPVELPPVSMPKEECPVTIGPPPGLPADTNQPTTAEPIRSSSDNIRKKAEDLRRAASDLDQAARDRDIADTKRDASSNSRAAESERRANESAKKAAASSAASTGATESSETSGAAPIKIGGTMPDSEKFADMNTASSKKEQSDNDDDGSAPRKEGRSGDEDYSESNDRKRIKI